jgi:hypothetical protein
MRKLAYHQPADEAISAGGGVMVAVDLTLTGVAQPAIDTIPKIRAPVTNRDLNLLNTIAFLSLRHRY